LLLQSLEPLPGEIDFVPRCLDALGRFLLKRVDDPERFAELHGIHDPKRIAPVRQGDLEYSRAKAVHRLGDIGLAALGGNRQCREADRLRRLREAAEVLPGSADPVDGPGLLPSSSATVAMLSGTTTTVKAGAWQQTRPTTRGGASRFRRGEAGSRSKHSPSHLATRTKRRRADERSREADGAPPGPPPALRSAPFRHRRSALRQLVAVGEILINDLGARIARCSPPVRRPGTTR
jgi:hypothetical protein